MPNPPRKGWWRRARWAVRWTRITVLSLILLALGGFIYLNRIGIPDFVRTRLIAELRTRGLDLQFSRMRLHWYRGLVAENINLGRAAQPFGPQLYIDLMELRLNPGALRHLALRVDSLLIRQARIVWPLVASNQPSRALSVENLTTELRFLPNDQWELDQFQASCLGTRLKLAGTLTNASFVRQWRFPRSTNQVLVTQMNRLNEFVDAMEKLRFAAPPEIHVMVQGDARHLASFNARVSVSAQAVTTPEAGLENLLLIARLNQPFATNGVIHSELLLRADRVRTPWARARDGRFTAELAARPDRIGLLRADWQLQALQATTRWGTAARLLATGHTRPVSTNDLFQDTTLEVRADPIQTRWGSAKDGRVAATLRNRGLDLMPAAADGNLQMNQAQTRWGTLEQLRLTAQWTRAPTNTPPHADASWAAWARLEPFRIDWQATGDVFKSERFRFRRLDSAGQWRAPTLTLDRVQANLYDGRLDATARLNVATRAAAVQGQLDLDLHQVEALLTSGSQRWLSQFTWKTPPRIRVQAGVVLPAWTDPHPDWRGQVLPALTLAGDFSAADAAFRGLRFSSATSHFTFTNLVWALPDLVVTGPGGRSELSYQGHLLSHDFHWSIDSHFDPAALAPWLAAPQQRALDLFQFHDPPWIRGEVWGQWFAPDRLGLVARVAASNLVFRGETCSRLDATVRFTNNYVTATDVEIRHGEQTVLAPGLGFDVARERLYLTNAFATIDPMVVARAIGPNTARSLMPYQFERPPTAHVSGSLRVHSPEQPDLRFDLAGGPFRYWRFDLPQVTGTVLWRGDWLTITNLDAAFYGGQLGLDAGFDLGAPREADFHFRAAVANANLNALVADLTTPTNRLDGTLNGNLTITSGNTADWGSWNGFGDVHLRDGYLWNLPLFGIFSPALNTVIPGLGKSRFTEGSAAFTITNSVIHTDKLETRSPALRLYYKGTVDFQGRVNARAEASLLRDTWFFGQLFSLALSPLTKIFEYKVTGTLEDPQSQPLYIPKLLLMPFHPFRTLKGLLFTPAATNAPPAAKNPS